jgi:hypothetical protein
MIYLIRAFLRQNETGDASQLTPRSSSQGQGKPTTKSTVQFSVYTFPERNVLFCKLLIWINLLSFLNRNPYFSYVYAKRGRAIAEAVSRWLPTAEARVRAQVWQVGFTVDKVASGQFFSSTSVSRAKTVHSTNFSIITITRGSQQRPYDELITRPRSPGDCSRSSNRN